MYMSLHNAEKLHKFSPVLAEIFNMTCRFLPSRPKKYRNVIDGVSGLIFTKIAQNAVPLTPVNRNCDIRIRCEMPAC